MEGRRLYVGGALMGIALADRLVAAAAAADEPKDTLTLDRHERKAKAETVEAIPVTRQDSSLTSRMTVEEAMRITGTKTPREAIRAFKAQGKKGMVYLPHVGAKERAKAAKRLAKMQAKQGAT